MFTSAKVKEILQQANTLNLNKGYDISPDEEVDLLTLPIKSLSEFFAPETVVKESTVCGISFNVMPDREVKEILKIKEYRIWDGYIEAVFDREYYSQMKKSPDHLIFLTALVHMQKMLYVYVCHKFNLGYNPHEEEKVKFWPVKLDISIPKLIRSNEDVVHKMKIESIEKADANTYMMKARSCVGKGLFINGESPFYILSK